MCRGDREGTCAPYLRLQVETEGVLGIADVWGMVGAPGAGAGWFSKTSTLVRNSWQEMTNKLRVEWICERDVATVRRVTFSAFVPGAMGNKSLKSSALWAEAIYEIPLRCSSAMSLGVSGRACYHVLNPWQEKEGWRQILQYPQPVTWPM